MLLQPADFTSQHEIEVEADVRHVWDALQEIDLAASRGIRLLLTLRGLPSSGVDLRALERFGFARLVEVPQERLALGLIGRFWTLQGDLQRTNLEHFLDFDLPGYARTTWEFRLEPAGQGTTRLVTETRIRCTDDASRRSFGRYWRVIAPFSGWIRKRTLELVRADAVRRASG